MAKRALMLIADGLGDRPIAELGGKTPLEYATTPNLDKLAALGICGMMDPIAPGIRAGSDTAHLALLGYNPHKYYTGRGPFEAMGVGLEVKGGDLAFRCNFATIDPQGIIVDRRAGRIDSGTADLAMVLDGMKLPGGITAYFKESTAHRAGLVLRGSGLSDQISDTIDPHTDGKPIGKAEPLAPEAQTAADAINTFVRESIRILADHPVNRDRIAQGLNPANVILPRGAGMTPHVPHFKDRWGFGGGAVVEVGLIRGIARYVGLELFDAPGSTGGSDTDEMSIAKTALVAASQYPFVLVNMKGPDLGGHDGDFQVKVQMIEKFDRLCGVIAAGLTSDDYIAVLGDHSTPCAVKDHSGDPLPIIICGRGVRTDDVTAYGERSCAKGGLGRVCGMDMLNILTQFIDKQDKFGA
jgi:2,3-bisphosphoglycerate-independent phosphoglycerate mutase